MIEELDIPGHLLEKIDLITLKEFVKGEGFNVDGTKEMILSSFLNSINIEDDDVEKSFLISRYHNFLLKTLKHNNNRIVVTYPMLITRQSAYFSEANLMNSLQIDDISELNYSKVIFGETLKQEEFTEIFRHVNSEDGDIKLIEICYGRIKIKTLDDGRTKTYYEYVWCEIDNVNKKFRIILSNSSIMISKDDKYGSNSLLRKGIEKLVSSSYGVLYSDFSNGKKTLFKMYKYLTAHIEEPYQKKVEPFDDEILSFANDMKGKLDIGDNENEDVGIYNRIKKLFERSLIYKDFENFRTRKVNDGRIISVNYADEVGGNVKANSGGSFRHHGKNKDLDLQDSRVYFDIKESIYKDEELNSIQVAWVNKSELIDDRYSKIEVKYTCYENFYITHFMNSLVREEIYNYVLPKFDEYRRKP